MQGQPPTVASKQQHKPATTAGHGPFDPSTCKVLYVGNLHAQLTENVLQSTISHLGFHVQDVKIIKDKVSGLSAGYGFVKFMDHGTAAIAMQRLNTEVWYDQQVRVNWAFQKDQREDTSDHHNIFVGDLSSDINDLALFEAFQHCEQCSDARVMWDHATNRSKGYGFVSFRTLEAAEAAINSMNGKLIGHRRTRCGWAQHKQNVQSLDYAAIDRSDPHNCNVYVGNVSQEATEVQLRQAFEPFGTVTDVKIYRKGSYGFVSYQRHEEAVNAIVSMNGQALGSKSLKCCWGRHQPRQNAASNMQMLQMQSQLQYLNAQAIQQSMLQMPGELQGGMLNRQQLLSPLQMSNLAAQHAQHGQQQLPNALLLQQSLAMAQQSLHAPQANQQQQQQQQEQQQQQQQLLAAQRAQMDPNSLYYGMYYGGV